MLSKPVLRVSTDRSLKPKQHPTCGGPEDWLTDDIFELKGLHACSFDFFWDWKRGTISKEIWEKRIVESSYTPWPQTDIKTIQQALYDCDGQNYITNLAQLANKIGCRLVYHLFKDSDWYNTPTSILRVELNTDGSISTIIQQSLADLMENIRSLSGGPVQLGEKGLFLSTSYLA